MGVNQTPKSSLVIPIKLQTGFDSQAEADPVTANTTKMMTNWKLEVIPQRFFNLSILA